MRKKGRISMSILTMTDKRKRVNRPLFRVAGLVILALMFVAVCLPGPVLAVSVFDVVKEVARATSHIEEGFNMDTLEFPITGGSMISSFVGGDLNTGERWAYVWFSVDEPAGNASMARLMENLEASLDEDVNMKVIAMDGYEIRELTHDDYRWELPNDDVEVWIILARHVIQVDISDTGYDKTANLQMGRNLALQLKASLEKAGLTSPTGASAAPTGAAPAAETPG